MDVGHRPFLSEDLTKGTTTTTTTKSQNPAEMLQQQAN